jgi:hypothetical protein
MTEVEKRFLLGLIQGLGTAVLLFVFGVIVLVATYRVGVIGIDYMHNTPLRLHIDVVAVPLAAAAAAWGRWGAGWITTPQRRHAIRARSRWGEEGTPVPVASPVRPLLPWLGAVVLCAVFWYWFWWGFNPHDVFGIDPQFGVQRWISVALMAGVGYAGMMLFPRLTASMAGAVAGPALFAVVGYTLFPSFMVAAS